MIVEDRRQLPKENSASRSAVKADFVISPLSTLIEGIKLDGMPTLEAVLKGLPDDGGWTSRAASSKSFGLAADDCFTILLKRHTNRLLALDKFKGQVVVDLGAGSHTIFAYNMAIEAGASAYIAVEPYFPDRAITSLNHYFSTSSSVRSGQGKYQPEIPIAIAAEDMLSFLRRLPDSSVSILLSGIDCLIISNPENREAISAQLARVLSPQGACVAYSSFDLVNVPTLRREWLSFDFERYTKVE